MLTNLSDADPATILENFELIEGLETTKRTAAEIEEQQKQARITEVTIIRTVKSTGLSLQKAPCFTS